MEELFRFTITRAADRTNAETLPLERKSTFQRILVGAAKGNEWQPLVQAAMTYTKGELQWILALNSAGPPAPVAALRQLLSALQAMPSDSPPAEWQAPIEQAMAAAKSSDLEAVDGVLADLFLAVLIVRSIGPTSTNKIIRAQGVQPDMAEVLLDRPSLGDIADLLRMIQLIKDALLIIGGSSTIDIRSAVRAALERTLLLPPGVFSQFEKPVHAVGITDLLVVKQHVARYEMGEVAKIENILKGESRDRAQKHTLSNERDTTITTSTETQTDQELTSTDHISLQNEIESTLKEDTKIDAGVHVQYDGGSLKAQADLTVGYDRSSSDSKKFASNIAKDVTQKAAKKVTQKTEQSVTTKIIETFEETEDQSFNNAAGLGNVSGVYQWVEKVYLAQVFNYGRHLLFDIMVPEPAASLLAAAGIPPADQSTAPIRPVPLTITPNQLIPAVANDWIGKLQVSGVPPPLPASIVIADAIVADGRDQSQGDVKVNKTIDLADGYAAQTLNLTASWYTGNAGSDYQIDIQVGTENIHIKQSDPPTPTAWGDKNYSTTRTQLKLGGEQKSIAVSIKTIFTEQISVNFEIVCTPAAEKIAEWQQQTYEKIVARWQQLESDYEQKISALQFQPGASGPLGSGDPDTNRQIERNELKRSCISILSNQPVNGFDAVVPKLPNKPTDTLLQPDLTIAQDAGSWVRWFEQAFEWDKIGYVFYPYYWGRSSSWLDKLNRRHDDALFLNFLQAGYARVVVPVRNGFEDAINFYLLTGKPWFGGGMPKIWDKGQNPLYLSITEEMKEQSGAPGDEIAVGDPWEIRLPTTLVKLRDDDKLPMWKWDPPGTYPPSPKSVWSWEEDKVGEQSQ